MSVTPEPEASAVWLVEAPSLPAAAATGATDRVNGFPQARRFATCAAALAALQSGPKPQLLVCDLEVLGKQGLAGLRKLKSLSPQTHIIALAAPDDLPRALRALRAGGSGLLLKQESADHPPSAALAPLVAQGLLPSVVQGKAPRRRFRVRLTPREKQVLALMVQGLTRKEMAEELGVSFHTANTQLRTIYEKLRVHTRSAAVVKALTERLL